MLFVFVPSFDSNSYAIEVESTDGLTYVYGVNAGFLLRLEHGNTFSGTDITHTIWFGDIALAGDGVATIETSTEYHMLFAVSKDTADISVTHYGDSSTTGGAFTLEPYKSGYRIIRKSEHKTFGPHLFHSWKFVVNTNDQTRGFEPLFFATLFKKIRNYVKDWRE
jgi:hypothetical protein